MQSMHGVFPMCSRNSQHLEYLTILWATLIISGKYLIDGRNFSWISHSKKAVLFAASRPSLAAMLENRIYKVEPVP